MCRGIPRNRAAFFTPLSNICVRCKHLSRVTLFFLQSVIVL